MNISFCISADSSHDTESRLKEIIIPSILDLNILNYEILIISENHKNNFININNNITYIPFLNTKYKKWITKKKNLLFNNARYENLVIMHDYFSFDKMWYKHFVDFGEDWDVCSNSQLLQNNQRHWLDWTVWDDPIYSRYTGLCYNNWSRTKYMYISGAYYLIKKHIAIQYPLNENLVWGQAEDVEWSLRIRNKCLIKCNGNSVVKHCKSHRDLNYKNHKFEYC